MRPVLGSGLGNLSSCSFYRCQTCVPTIAPRRGQQSELCSKYQTKAKAETKAVVKAKAKAEAGHKRK